MRNIFFKVVVVVSAVVLTGCFSRHDAVEERPNILFIIADDASFNSMSIYGSQYVKTANFDKLANEGILFTNAYSNNPKCAPARASILTGRYSWQLEEAVVHRPLMPEKWMFYPELLESSGYFVGHTGKGWGPGLWKRGDHNPAGRNYDTLTLKPPYKGMSTKDYSENFKLFLEANEADKPFCFWLGTQEPHRNYEKDSYLKAGRSLEDVKVQKFFPDNKIVRGDLMDYALEVEWFDQQIGKAMKILEDRGELGNTIIIVTSDHGMPFPRVKGQIYEEGVHVPLAVRWGDRIQPGRVVNDFINFPDIAPTLMEAAGLKPHAQMTGKSFLDLLLSDASGWLDSTRAFSILGKERHDIGRDDGAKLAVGYPVRGIRTKDYLYSRNYEPQRWPAGNPEHGFRNSDDGPTEDYLVSVSANRDFKFQNSLNPDHKFYELCFSFRPEVELYDMKKDPDCMNNLASFPQYREAMENLASKLQNELIKQEDPRALGNSAIFDTYYYMGFQALKDLYGERFKVPDHLKKYEFISNGKVE
ncbi:MAG: sulfatase [Cyclobacteriaceae bacterium]